LISDSGPVIVGLISDTHGLLRPQVADAFEGVTLIVHAGDVGARSVLEGLRRIAPIEAVFGNVDDANDPALARERAFPIGELTLHVSHGHELPRAAPEILLARYPADIVVFGHTHRWIARRSRTRIAINPGAAGPRRFDIEPTVARLTVTGTNVHLEFVSLIDLRRWQE
jgi:putative phosphoesterase